MENRKKLLNTLGRQRNRLKSKNARPKEITDYFGIDVTTRFADLTNKQLQSIYQNISNQPRVTVTQEGTILPTQYISRFKAWNGENTTRPIAKKYKTAIESNFIKKDKSLKDTRLRKKEFDRYQITKYAKQLEEIAETKEQLKTVEKIKKFTPNQFNKYIDAGGGKIDFDVIYYPDKYSVDDPDEQSSYQSIFDDVEKTITQTRKRRK